MSDEMAERVLRTYRDIFSGDERRDPVETVAQRVQHTYRDILSDDESAESGHTRPA